MTQGDAQTALVRKYQQALLDGHRDYFFKGTSLSEAVTRAYWAVPRHEFVRRYRLPGTRTWTEVTPTNLTEHLGRIYGNTPMWLYGEDEDGPCSTNSQPGMVLRMLDMLGLKEGHRVLDLGCGTGWTSALMGHIVGRTGRVQGIEIISELAEQAAASMKRLGLDCMSIPAADGVFGFDDYLVLLEKHRDHFECREAYPAGAVVAQGAQFGSAAQTRWVEDLPQIHPATAALEAGAGQWLVRRSQAQYLWSLPRSPLSNGPCRAPTE